MHVIRVEIENIKSYDQAEFSFERGITAIVGRNGAGKTTILEAIAWVLFDNLDYSKEDFLRRGAKKGSVRVTFESDVDGRHYIVYRDTGQGYYVFDPGLGLRIAEKKTDVSAFIRLHLGIEVGTDLKALFRSAIGVPQGSFTTEFLLPPNARKAYFDKLLKVEEYRESADNLRETLSLIRERTADIRERIAGAEGKLIRYDELVEESNLLFQRLHELDQSLVTLQKEIDYQLLNVNRWDEAKQRVVETRTKADRLAIEFEATERRLKDLDHERQLAEQACEVQKSTQADHLLHLDALDQLQLLDKERSHRDQLKREAEKNMLLHVSVEAKIKNLQESLKRAEQARVIMSSLEGDIEKQEELERERERLRDLRAQAAAYQERLIHLDKELDTLRKQHMQVKERIKQAERGREAVKLVENLESDRVHLENQIAVERDLITNLKHLEDQRQEILKDIKRLKQITASLNKELQELGLVSTKAVAIRDLESSEQDLANQAARLRAEIARDERMRLEIKGGLCPILSERCLNIGEGQTLDTYFTDQLSTNRTQLDLVEKQRIKVSDEVRMAREAEKLLSKADDIRARYNQEQELLSERETRLAQIEDDIAKFSKSGPNHLAELQWQMIGIDAELKNAREEVLRYAELEPLRLRLKEIEEEGKRKKDARSEFSAAAAALPQLDDDIAQIEAKLRTLNDPRGRAKQLRVEAEREKEWISQIETAHLDLTSLDKNITSINEQLKLYDELDAKWKKSTTLRDKTLDAHRAYISSQSLAATLPTRQAAYEKASTELSNIASQLEITKSEAEQALSNYDSEKHLVSQVALSTARERAAAINAQIENARDRASSIQKEIDHLSEVRLALQEEFIAKERLDQLGETTDFIRDILKQAGPLVTESYLYNISIEANQLFREITGEAGRTLRWTRDYEIVLEEEGHERPFANLSGGEQMAAALSIRLALLKQLSDIRIAFFDEPTVNMDEERRERLAQAIGQIRNFDQLFVISHDDTFEEFVDHIVHVEREGVLSA
jgi:DNA repair protein SbcC/Rad50